jgi:HK97 family phage prohead protease
MAGTRKVAAARRRKYDDVFIEQGAVRHGMVEDLAPFTRRAPLTPSSYDETAQTVEAVISTGAPVRRRDHIERLDLSDVEPATLIGLPVLDGHRQATSANVVGVIAEARREGTALVAIIRLSQADDAANIRTKIAEGVLRGVSLGYGAIATRESVENGQRVRTIVPRIREVSFVAIPADPAAQVRSKEMEDDIIEMPPEQADQIRALAEAVGLTRGWAEDRIDEAVSIEDARKLAREALTRKTPTIRTVASNDDPATITRRQTDALAYRMAGGDLPDDARHFVGMSVRDTAIGSLERAGVSTRGLSTDDILTRAAQATNSDFPLIVSNAMNKVALDAYKAAESPIKTLCRQRTLPNFKESTSIRAGELGRLEEMTESGEFTHTTRAESGETMRLKTFGRALNASRKLFIDDDAGVLGDMTAAFGEAAAQTEADLLVSLLLDNPNMRDGDPVFDAGRGNIGTAGAVTVEALAEARQAMRLRTGLDGKTLISATARYLLVGADRETEAEKVLASIQPAETDNVNPFAGKLVLLVEPRIQDGSWYLFADPARLVAMQYAYLSAAPGVQIQRTEAWDVLGMKFRAWLDFGAGWVDWRGAHYNEGD